MLPCSMLLSPERRSISIERLVLINPATSYDRTQWPTIGPLIANSGAAFPAVGVGKFCCSNSQSSLSPRILGAATLMLTAVQREQFLRIGRQIVARINSTESAVEVMNSLIKSGSRITELLPPATLSWRLRKWLMNGAFLMNTR